MDFTDFKQFSLKKLWDMNLSKQDLVKIAIPEDVTFDYALPQDWLDAATNFIYRKALRFNPKEDRDYIYRLILGTTYMLYSRERGFQYGWPWSACTEINDQLEAFIQQ